MWEKIITRRGYAAYAFLLAMFVELTCNTLFFFCSFGLLCVLLVEDSRYW
jgi:hypothetical protein